MPSPRQRRAAEEIWGGTTPLSDEVVEAYIDHTGRGKPLLIVRATLENPWDRVTFDDLCTSHRFMPYMMETGWPDGEKDFTFPWPGDFEHSSKPSRLFFLRWYEGSHPYVPHWLRVECTRGLRLAPWEMQDA